MTESTARLDLTALNAFVDAATQTIAKHSLTFVLAPDQLLANNSVVPSLNWQAVPFADDGALIRIPDNKRGVYAFAIRRGTDVLPPHGYILYIGIAGRRSQRSLRDRYKDYLSASHLIRRSRIARMIATWHEVLTFYFAPVEAAVTSTQLETLERELNSALIPPFSEGDLEADLKQKRRAFR
ncbi:MAG: hypothetical protein OXF79_01970 [Chloroflexi bacterium]|nr:hypothetical protein [Chloroflexota bacterium]